MKPIDKKKSAQRRIVVIGFIFGAFLVTIGIRAVYLQVCQGPWLSAKASDEYEKSFKFQGKRGTIYDTKHREMAVSNDITSIAAYPKTIQSPQSTANLIADPLKIRNKALYRKLASKKSFVWIKRQVTPKEAKAIERMQLEGIHFITEHSRFYPNKTLFAQVLGFSGIDGRGLEGIEFYYDTYLKGINSQFTVLRDALGRCFDGAKSWAADNSGKNLILTIDRAIQYTVEKALEEAAVQFSAKSGMAIVMAAQTGAVLAMAHFPFFNPNCFGDFDRELWRNRAITDPFEPGSTMKIFLAAAALESGDCNPDTIFFCENGAYKVGRNIVHDTHARGWLSLQQIIKYSSNIGAVKISEKIGSKVLYNTLKNFGFGVKTGIDCPGETAGSLSDYKRWTRIDSGTIAFGQGLSVSAIQLITAVCAIANDGVLMKPYIVQAVTDTTGRSLENFSPKPIRRVVSEQTAKRVRKIMKTVIADGGTGEKAALEGYTVCGKTGTAQKINAEGTYAKDKYVSSFIGFAPADHPEVAILVLINEPEEQHYGGIVAAPAFKKIAHETLSYLNIPPKNITDEMTVAKRK
ncbi:MAG: penicillin-binding protein 2 [Desulfobacterales bacterium]|nr:penicillin-binding protein 2 [Desulfobacterales bacterium]